MEFKDISVTEEIYNSIVDIGTEWNLKQAPGKVYHLPPGVDIGTEWNLKEYAVNVQALTQVR